MTRAASTAARSAVRRRRQSACIVVSFRRWRGPMRRRGVPPLGRAEERGGRPTSHGAERMRERHACARTQEGAARPAAGGYACLKPGSTSLTVDTTIILRASLCQEDRKTRLAGMSERERLLVHIAVDLAILTVRDDKLHVLVVERGNEPYRGG